ncbi:PepSY-associated TM helix domain-containing protein [Bacteroides propionicifaciens]|uniref:PepSY-associated TM helix domain-containing protein n=1 Tax=Bacteroides propionicifaciens TaxID=392838 RepID=UPI00039C52F6|nr:PepSY-associated TM helix domain-containing protein [Bacteroides propionicifaciens]
MKRLTWKKHHKWIGLLFCPFIILFCISGILLNHRTAISSLEINRKYLPSSFRYEGWNNSLVKGTLSYKNGKDSAVLLYGNAGVWEANSSATEFKSFNTGFPKGVDNRNIQAVKQTLSGRLFAASQFGLYHKGLTEDWQILNYGSTERLTDLIIKGDSLIAVGRSKLYISTPPYTNFKPMELKAPNDYKGEVTMFRTVWLIHSGQLFGVAGKIIVDLLGVILIIISVTGVLFWLLPKQIKRQNRKAISTAKTKRWFRLSLNWHDKLGRYTFGAMLFLAITGWALRPPLLIALAQTKIPAIPTTMLDSSNPWNDRIRALRYDSANKDWLLSSSEGLYQLDSLTATPIKIEHAPPISVMGINVFEQKNRDHWLIGSFSGLYVWDRNNRITTDYFTKEITEEVSGPPFGKRAITGYSSDFKNEDVIFEYEKPANFVSMPQFLRTQPISLWNIALEVHTGRIYTFLGAGTLIYIFFAGILVIWALISGYKIRRPKRKNRR